MESLKNSVQLSSSSQNSSEPGITNSLPACIECNFQLQIGIHHRTFARVQCCLDSWLLRVSSVCKLAVKHVEPLELDILPSIVTWRRRPRSRSRSPLRQAPEQKCESRLPSRRRRRHRIRRSLIIAQRRRVDSCRFRTLLLQLPRRLIHIGSCSNSCSFILFGEPRPASHHRVRVSNHQQEEKQHHGCCPIANPHGCKFHHPGDTPGLAYSKPVRSMLSNQEVNLQACIRSRYKSITRVSESAKRNNHGGFSELDRS